MDLTCRCALGSEVTYAETTYKSSVQGHTLRWAVELSPRAGCRIRAQQGCRLVLIPMPSISSPLVSHPSAISAHQPSALYINGKIKYAARGTSHYHASERLRLDIFPSAAPVFSGSLIYSGLSAKPSQAARPPGWAGRGGTEGRPAPVALRSTLSICRVLKRLCTLAALFCALKKFNCIIFMQLRTLWQKHRGWGCRATAPPLF